MSRVSFLFLAFILFSCLRDNDPIISEEIITEIPKPARFNVCEFDLSDKAGTFELEGKWEFAGFFDTRSNTLDNLTCTARWAKFFFDGEDKKNVYKIILEIKPSKFSGENPACKDFPTFETTGFKTKISGCYNVSNEPLISFSITEKIYVDKLDFTTLEEEASDEEYFAGLQNAIRYEIDKNKLYIYTDRVHQKMVFLALEN
ncbi:hypothetical protein [Aquiflexum gelatinilyticum]|uniref:hypothetical protein n=1 Tax=Aquiflexum gelatinilyticum TaxID=2961943 RepID=UPI00216A90ED|nr:hypothetical protein [Aquiflexum gelatinilyticum]MCS4433738.1 hypothetical protein [Aquiflexum gelatinilyticum]